VSLSKPGLDVVPYTQDFDWSPDGSRIAFSDNRQVIIIDVTGRHRRPLTSSSGDSRVASWSPDGARLVYWNNDDPTRWGLVVVNADGSAPRRLASTDRALVERASWSPDGTRIVFGRLEFRFDPAKSEYFDTWSLFIARVDTDVAVRLTTSGPCVDREPAWAPDGDRIVFAGCPEGPAHGLFIINADGSGLRRVTTSPTGTIDRHPAWSPAGDRIVFERGPLSNRDLFMVGADGNGLINLTEGNAGFDGAPRWRRR